MRLLPTAFGCMILVLLAATGMAQPLEAIPAVPAPPPLAAPGQYPAPAYGLEQPPSASSSWTVDTTNPVARNPGERTPYGGETTYIDPGCQNWQDQTAYDVRLEGLYYKLDRARDQALLMQSNGTTLLTVGNMDYQMEGGMRLTVAYDSAPEEGTKIEGTYFGIYDWGEHRTINGADNLQLPNNFGGSGSHVVGNSIIVNDYNSAASMAFRTEARINSVEANLVYSENKSRALAYMAGVRFMRFEEGIYITSRREVPELLNTLSGPQNFWGGVSNFNVTTQNDLFGIQGGMRAHRVAGPWDMALTGKFGLYSGTVSAYTYVTNSNNTIVERNGNPSNTGVAYSVEGTLALTYCLQKNLFLTGSYNVLWISQIARATDNLDFSEKSDSGTILDRDGIAFLHGLSCGLESRW